MYKSYFKKLAIFSAVILALTIGWVFVFPNLSLPLIYPIIVVYFFGITAIEHFLFVTNNAKGDAKKFIKTNMITTLAKFFIHLCVIMVYAFSYKGNMENIKRFLLFFAIIYIVYLVYDTYTKMRLAKK